MSCSVKAVTLWHPCTELLHLAKSRRRGYPSQMPPLRTPASVLFVLFLAVSAVSTARAASTPQRLFLTGESLSAPQNSAPNARPIQAAREIQAGPHRGETAGSYGRRVEAAALALGLNAVEAAQAKKLYLGRMTGGGTRPTGGSHTVDWTAALTNSRLRAGPLMHAPNWSAPTPLGPGGRTNPALARAFPAARPSLVMQPAPKRRAAVVPPLTTSATSRPTPTRTPQGSYLGLLFSRNMGGSQKADTFFSWGADYNRRGNAITEKNSGDSLLAWANRKRLKLQGTLSNLSGVANDPDTYARAWKSVRGAIAEFDKPRPTLTFRQQQITNIFTSVNSVFPMLGVAVGLAPVVQQGAVDVSDAVQSCRAHTSKWNCADSGLKAAGPVADAVGLMTLGGSTVLRRGALAVADEALAAGRFGKAVPRRWLREAEINPALAETLETSYRRTEELEKQFSSRKRAGASRTELDAIREESWGQYRQARDMQTQIPALKRFFAEAEPGTPGSLEYMRVVAANMGTEVETVAGLRLASYGSLSRDIKAGGIMPNPKKALEDGTLTGSGAHLLADGSPHMVSVAGKLQPGLVLLMTGYADASRINKIEGGIMYEFEGVRNAARLPPTRQVFFDALEQDEIMVPSVPLDRIRHVRAWRSRLNPDKPGQVIFEYTDRLPIGASGDADALLAKLKGMSPRNMMHVEIPVDPSQFSYRTEL